MSLYLEGLVEDLRTSVASVRDGREIRLETNTATWGAAEVTTLGLVLTELATNALKYGRGAVRVTFRQPPGDQAVLAVEDDGPGLPADFDPARSRGRSTAASATRASSRACRMRAERPRSTDSGTSPAPCGDLICPWRVPVGLRERRHGR